MVDAMRVIWRNKKKKSITGWGSHRETTFYPLHLRHDTAPFPRKPFLRSVEASEPTGKSPELCSGIDQELKSNTSTY